MNPQAAPQPLAASLTSRERWLLLFSLMITLFVGALDQSVISTATPKIIADLGGFNLLSWLFTSYMLTSTVIIPLVGKLGDLYGRKIFLIAGVAIFMVSSAACGAAPDMLTLIIFRAVQGIGGGMIFASVFASLGDMFTPAERGKYVGFFTGTFSLASLIGPTLGGFLTDNGGWRWIFFINIPVGLIAMPAIWFTLPSKPRVRGVKIDFMGASWLAAASVLFLLAFVWAGDKYAWASPQIIGLLVGSVAFVGAFCWQELRHPEPVIPLHLFKNRTFLISNLVVFTFGLGVFGAFQYLNVFVQIALGISATGAGIINTPQSLGVLLTSIFGGQIIARRGRYKWQTVLGTALIAIAMGFLQSLNADSSKWQIAAYVFVLGLGFGMVLPTMSLIIQNAVPFQYMGVATSSSQFFRQMGSVMGIAIFGAVLANSYTSEFNDRLTPQDAEILGAANVARLKDPTERLDEGRAKQMREDLAAVEGGTEALDRATRVQAESVARATHYIFLGAFAAAVLSLVFAILLKDTPLKRTFGPPQAVPSPAGGAGPLQAGGKAAVPEPKGTPSSGGGGS